jgi:hypothetical protein
LEVYFIMQSTLYILDLPMPEFAPFAAKAFLGAALFVFVCAVGAVISLAFRHPRIAAWIGAGTGPAASGYAALLFGAAFVSRDRHFALDARTG